VIEGEKLTKNFGAKKSIFFPKRKNTSTLAVKDITIRIPKGKITGVLGVNGAGKSTLIKLLSGMLEPTNGRCFIDGLPYKANENIIKRRIGLVVGSDLGVYHSLTGYENLEYFSSLYGMSGKLQANKIVKLLDLVGLSDKQDVKVENYSLGMKQRLKFAIGIVHDPEYIFLDEPTLGLDVIISKILRKLIKTVSEEKGVLLTTHYMEEAEQLCDYIYLIDDGKVIFEGTADQLVCKANICDDYFLELVDPNDNIRMEKIIRSLGIHDFKADKEKSEIRFTSDSSNFGNILQHSIRNNIEFKAIERKKTTLEDAVVSLLRKEERSK
jgi:ABC-2 type transport system ATP-binding protein